MGFAGGEVGVGGRSVGISVGGMGVAEGITIKVVGTKLGVEVTGMGFPSELHPARDGRNNSIRIGNRDFDFNLSSCDQDRSFLNAALEISV